MNYLCMKQIKFLVFCLLAFQKNKLILLSTIFINNVFITFPPIPSILMRSLFF